MKKGTRRNDEKRDANRKKKIRNGIKKRVEE